MTVPKADKAFNHVLLIKWSQCNHLRAAEWQTLITVLWAHGLLWWARMVKYIVQKIRLKAFNVPQCMYIFGDVE